MGKKFGFHLAPLKIPTKSETDALKKALDGEFSPLTTPVSPLIDRQPIGREVEAELKNACKILVEKTGNAHHNSQEDAIVNFSSLQRAAQLKGGAPKKSAKSDAQPGAKEASNLAKLEIRELPKRASSLPPTQKTEDASPAVAPVPVPAAAPAPASVPQPQSKDKASAEASEPVEYDSEDDEAEEIDSAIQATKPAFPPRRDSLCSQKHASVHGSILSVAIDTPVPPMPAATAHAAQDSVSSSCDLSVGDASPITASTDNQAQNESTAPTTVAVTPAHKTARTEIPVAVPAVAPVASEDKSRQDPIAHKDLKAAEIAREGNTAVQPTLDPTSPPTMTATTTAPTPAPELATERVSREKKPKSTTQGKNIVTEVKDFVKNRSRSRSRGREPGSFRRATSMSLESIRSSWYGLRRKSSMYDIPAPPGTAYANESGLVNNASSSKMNLHRDLPPLPSLEVLKQAQAEQDKEQQAKDQVQARAEPHEEQSAKQPAQEPINEPAKKSAPVVKEPLTEPAEELPKTPAKQSRKLSSKKSVKESLRETFKEAMNEAKGAMQELSKKPVKEASNVQKNENEKEQVHSQMHSQMQTARQSKDLRPTTAPAQESAATIAEVEPPKNDLKPVSAASAVPEPSPEPSNTDKLKMSAKSSAASLYVSKNIVEQKLDAEMKKLDAQKKQAAADSQIRRTTVHIVTAQRPKTSGGLTPMTRSRAGTDALLRPTYRARSSSLKSVRKPSVSVCTATLVPVRTVRKMEKTDNEADARDKDSVTDSDNEGSKCGSEVGKAATIVHKPSMESVRQINIKSRRNTSASALSHSYAPSQASSSRPQSRAALAAPASGARTPNSVRYTIIPHQRTPSQPIYLSRSAASSVVNVPPRPVTRDSSGTQLKSRMPSVITRNDQPPVPPNFSRKIVEGSSRPTTSAGAKHVSTSGGDFTALPQFQSKKPISFRRMLSSINLKKMKSDLKALDLRWPSRDGQTKTAAAPTAAAPVAVA